MIPRYSRPEISAVWTDENKYRTWLQVELAVLQARAEAGDIPRQAFEEISQKADFTVERIEKLEAELHHDVIAFISTVGEYIGGNSRYFHQGMTSSDVLDTALALQLKQSSDILEQGLEALSQVLAAQARKYKTAVMAGRTHGVHAEPITFGLKLASFYAELQRGR